MKSPKVYFAGSVDSFRKKLFHEGIMHSPMRTFKNGCFYMGPSFSWRDLGYKFSEDYRNVDDHFDEDATRTYRTCVHQIEKSDILFVWIDKIDPHGTLFEIGYAKALKKKIFVAFESLNLREEMWFIRESADGWCSDYSLEDAWNYFANSVAPRIICSENEYDIEVLTTKQVKYFMHLLLKNNLTFNKKKIAQVRADVFHKIVDTLNGECKDELESFIDANKDFLELDYIEQ